MAYKLRNSESTRSPLLVEYTQGGILIRFDIKEAVKEDITFYQYKEFWFNFEATNIEEVVKAEGFELTNEYKDLLK